MNSQHSRSNLRRKVPMRTNSADSIKPSSKGGDRSVPERGASRSFMMSSKKSWFGKSSRHNRLGRSDHEKLSGSRRNSLGWSDQHKASDNAKPTRGSNPTPQAYLDSMLLARGYSTQVFPSLKSAYFNKKPSPLQQASYGVRLIDAVKNGELEVVRSLLQAGLSPNACNQNGESLVHAVCRRGQANMLSVLLEYGCEVSVSDNSGRTPMHEACQGQPCFAVADLLLQKDTGLFHMADARGKCPLECTNDDYSHHWTKFLMKGKNMHWPERVASKGVQGPPPLALEKPNSRPVPDPKRAIPMSIATLLAAGRMELQEAERLLLDYNSSISDDEERSSNSEEDDESVVAFSEQDLANAMNSFRGPALNKDNSVKTSITLHSDDDDSYEENMKLQPNKQGRQPTFDFADDGASFSSLFADDDEIARVVSSIGGLTSLTWSQSPKKRPSSNLRTSGFQYGC